MPVIQPVSINNLYNYKLSKAYSMIDNYVYLYHTDTLIAIPMYPEQIQDSMAVGSSNSQTPLMRSAPIYTYSGSGPRSLQIELQLHRDMMNQINATASRLNISNIGDDYVDILVNQLQAAALPKYAASEKMVNPPIVAVRFGNAIFCKGIVTGSVSVTHSGPILTDDKYACLTVSFNISEIDPYDAASVMLQGGYRGLSTTLERRIWKETT